MRRWEDLSRRDFLRLTGGGLTVLTSGCSLQRHFLGPEHNQAQISGFLKQYGPIDRTINFTKPQSQFAGDDNHRPHKILWDVDTYLADKKIEVKEEANLVIIGGGASGLFSAYTMKEYQPILLEQNARFGGNARGESWKGLDYSMGSAYLDAPRKGTPIDKLARELGIYEISPLRKGHDPVELKGKLYKDFWEGETEPTLKAKYEKMDKLLESIFASTERDFPLMPALTEGQLNSIKYYDQWTLHDYLTKQLDGIPPHLETAIEHYCYSTFACSSKELSAAPALNFLAQELDPAILTHGGNSRIVERVLERLLENLPAENLRASSIAVRVKVHKDHCIVLYEDANGSLREIKAKAVVMCCPKFVVKHILQDLGPERLDAINRLKFRSYMTATLLVKRIPEQKFYDLFMVDQGKTGADVDRHSERMNATDVILANYASPEKHDHSLLTLYRGYPHDGARSELYRRDAFKIQKEKFERQVNKKILPLLKLKKDDVIGMRMALWGHAMPIPEKGFYSAGDLELIRMPFKERVFFAEQDNWAFPSIHTGATEIALFKDQLEKMLDA